MAGGQLDQDLAEIKELTGDLEESIGLVLERIRDARMHLAPWEPPIAFVHIPKTAGGTVSYMFRSAYSRGAMHDAGNFTKFGRAKLNKPLWGWDSWSRRGGRLVVGHVPYGVFRQVLPSDTRYMTFLRDPVDRALSHYHNHVRVAGISPDQRRLGVTNPLEEAFERRLPVLTNLATRFLCGHPSPLDELPPTALDDAKANLREFAFVGIQKRFEESVVLLQRRFALGTVPYVNRHVSVHRPAVEEITAEQRALIAEHNQLDAELYAFATELFEEAVAASDPEFAADVENLRELSAAANEEAIQSAYELFDRELPLGAAKPKEEVFAAAAEAGVPAAAIKHVKTLLGVEKARQGQTGHKIWVRADDSGRSPDLSHLKPLPTEKREHRLPTDDSRRTQVIAFVRVPKGGGGTVKSMLMHAYGRDQIREAGHYLRNPEQTVKKVKRAASSAQRVMVGRMPFGLLLDHLPPDTRYITVVRDPVQRVVSYYEMHLRRLGADDAVDPGKASWDVRVDTLEEALIERRLVHVNDLMTRFLCGRWAEVLPASPLEPAPELDGSDLEEARTNLKRFMFVGVEDELAASMALLERALELDAIPYIQPSVEPPPGDSLSDEDRAVIVEHNSFDLELYRDARAMFESRVEEAGPDLASEIERLRAASEAATAEHHALLRKADEWVDNELSSGQEPTPVELRARAEAAGISMGALRLALGKRHRRVRTPQ